jgi:hypothetical protein
MRKNMRDEESLRRELDCDLEQHLFESEPGFELDHPLVRELRVRPDRVTYLNELYRSKFASSVQAIKDGDWSGYVELHERPHRIFAFMEVMHELDDPSYWELLAHFWIDCENVWQNPSEWKDLWSSGRLQKQFAMTIEDRQALAAMADKMTIYRGVGKAKYGEGLSWSLSREKAIWFGERRSRVGGDYCLITATTMKHDVHALLHGRGEQEVVAGKVLIVSRETLQSSRGGSR